MEMHFKILQAQPNAGVMQIVLLIIVVTVIYFISKANKKKRKQDEIEKMNALSNSDTNINNIDIRSAGYEFINAGKKLVKSVIVFVCAILFNLFCYIKFNEEVKKNVYAIKEFQEFFKTVLYIDLALCIIIVGLLYMGFYSIRKAGESLFKN